VSRVERVIWNAVPVVLLVALAALGLGSKDTVQGAGMRVWMFWLLASLGGALALFSWVGCGGSGAASKEQCKP